MVKTQFKVFAGMAVKPVIIYSNVDTDRTTYDLTADQTLFLLGRSLLLFK
jgi:hypothetical protein